MIILTGYEGFIGKAFENKLDSENLYRVGQGGAELFIEQYEDWDKVDLILHQGAISSTVETCLLYTSPSPRDATLSRMPSSA